MKPAIQAVLAAIEQGDRAELSRLLEADPQVLADEFWAETPPLVVAVKTGMPAIVEALLQHGVDVNGRDSTGCTALHYAVDEGVPVETPALLLDVGADVMLRCGFSNSTPLHVAAGANNAQAVGLLLRHGADVNALDSEQATPVFHAARNGCAAAAYLLMLQRGDAAKGNADGYSPAFMAAQTRGDNGETLGVLLRYGAEFDLHTAILLGMTQVTEGLLVANPALIRTEPNAADFLTTAVWTLKVPLVQLLISSGFDVNACKHYGLPLLEAVRRIPVGGDGPALQIAELLLQAGANPHTKSPSDGLSAVDWVQQHNPSLLSILTR
jgi:ankyrin repeat protein